MADPNNHDQFDHGNAFSGWGDIDRSADGGEPDGVSTSGTSERSRAANAAAAEAERNTDFGRAFPQAGSGGSVGDDGVINHVFGDS